MVSKMVASGQKVIVVPVSVVSSPLSRLPWGAAVGEGLPPDVALAPDLDVEAAGERVHHGDADAVQAAGDGVSAAAELAAGVQDGHHDLDGGLVLGRVDVDRDAAAVVDDLTPPSAQDDLDVRAVAGERLVDGVVDDLVDQVVQAARAGRSDVHAGRLRTASRPSSTLMSLRRIPAVSRPPPVYRG